MKFGKELVIQFGSGVVFGVLWGVLTAILEENEITDPPNFGVAVVILAVSMLLHIIIHELGHLEAGLISGYEFCSFRIGNRMWVKENSKIRLKKYSIPGTAGQCLMIPPEDMGYDYPVILYNLGGILANIIVSVIVAGLAILLRSSEMLLFPLIGMYLAIINGVPMRIQGGANDGMNVKCLKKEPLAMQAFDCQLRSNALLIEGKRLKDMPEEWFVIPDDSDLKDVNTGTMIYMQIARMLDGCEFDIAKEKIQWTLEHAKGMLGLHKNELKCELIFCNIMSGEYEEAEKLYEYEMKKYIDTTKSWLSRRRLMYAYYLLVEKDEEKAQKELKVFNKIKKTSPNTGEIKGEEEMLEFIDARKASVRSGENISTINNTP